MKKLVLHIVLLSYTVVMLKPALPYVSDLIGHVFFYTQHMATVHYENGKIHVHKEIVDNAKKTEPAKESASSKKESSTTDHIGLLQKNGQHQNMNAIQYFIPSSSLLLYNDIRADYPPPRA